MKKLIYSSLFAMLLLASCQNETKKEVTNSLDTNITATIPKSLDDEQKVYNVTSIDTPATYPGGISEFYKFIGNNLKFPTAAIKSDVQGSVLTSFIIEQDGTLSDIKVEKKLGLGTDEEAIRVLKLSKKWNPAKLDGKPVRVKYSMPIKFTLAK
jgi:TonB family protein